MRSRAALLLVLAACGSKDSSSSASPGPGSGSGAEPRPAVVAPVAERTPDVVLPVQRSFKLLEPGKNPAVLRYALVERTASYAATTRQASRRLAGATWSPRADLPAMTTTLQITRHAPGSVMARALPAQIEGGATPATEQYLGAWKAITNRRVAIELDDRGQLGAVAFADDPTGTRDAGATDDLVQRLLATLVPLPDEPVGIGGAWRVVTVLRQRPAVVKQTVTYTLRERSATSWTIDVELQRVGEPQTLVDPSIPADTEIELVALVRTLRGTLTIDPAAPLGVGTLAAEATMHLRMRQATRGGSATADREEILEDTGTITLAVH